MSTDKQEIEIALDHPMEDILDIESGTTLVPSIERKTELVEAEEYDNKDNEIEEQIQEVYDAAMDAFEVQQQEAELVEGKYKARNSEVAVQFLNLALNAARDKSTLKQHKDNIAVKKGSAGPKTVNQNLIVGDRNEILKQLMGGDKEDE